MAAILTRLRTPASRSAPDWKLHTAKGATLGGLIQGDPSFIAGPETAGGTAKLHSEHPAAGEEPPDPAL